MGEEIRDLVEELNAQVQEYYSSDTEIEEIMGHILATAQRLKNCVPVKNTEN